ncbi:MAG: magnesium transporter [Rhodobacteraceae bacterium]|jgi:magnesium transporter|nr:magnesium transporter [Paracoccaceae bacterium]
MTDDRPTDRDDYGLDPDMVAAIRAALDAGDAAGLATQLDPLHPADIADLLEQVAPDERRALVRLYAREFDGDILSELDETLREEVIAALAPDTLAEAVRDLDSDDVVDLIEDLDAPAQAAILRALSAPDRAAVEQALTFPDHSAGRLMQREVVTAPEHWTVGDAIDHLRASEGQLPDQFYHIVLVDPAHRPTGYVTLGRVLSSRRDTGLASITEDSFRTFGTDEPDADVAYAFNQYHLISAPVVDKAGRLVGVITIDDAMAVLDEEHEEDILRLAGAGEARMSDGVWQTVVRRLPWLVINLFTASLSAIVITRFEDTIAQLVLLAALMPIVASTGGIGGTQSLAVAVRALATKSLTAANARRVIARELLVGLLNGAGLALLLGAAGALIFGQPMLGLVLGLAMVANQVVAALGGVLVPLTLNRLGFDPALASGTFVTTLTDVMGFFAFLGLATLVLL